MERQLKAEMKRAADEEQRRQKQEQQLAAQAGNDMSGETLDEQQRTDSAKLD